MKFLNFLIVSFVLCIQSSFGQTTENFEQKAKQYFKAAKYDSASFFYKEAAKQYEQEQNWLLAVKNYSLSSHAFKIAGKFDAAWHLITKAYDIAHLKFRTDSKEEMSEESNVLVNIAQLNEKKGRYNEAIINYKQALHTIMGADSSAQLKIASVWNSIGNAFSFSGNYDSALFYCNKSLSLRLKFLREDNIDVSFNYSYLGAIFLKKEEFDKALTYYQKALKSRLAVLGEIHINTANTYTSIGLIYERKGEYDKALDYYQKALKIKKTIFGEQHYDITTLIENIGMILFFKGRYEEAIEYYKKALKIRFSVMGEQHSDVAFCYNDIGIAYLFMGDYDKALEYNLKALKIRIAVCNEGHPEIAASYGNVALAYKNKGEYDKALEYYKKSIGTSGKLNNGTASNYNNIGVLLILKGELDSALVYCQKALDIRISIYGEKHPFIASCYTNIGLVHENKKEYDIAIEYYQKALNMRQEFYGIKHCDVAANYLNIGELEYKKGNYLKALQNYQSALVANVPDFNNSSVYQNPPLLNLFSKPIMMEILFGKAKTFYKLFKEVSNSFADLEGSLTVYELAFQLINKMRNEYNIEDTKLLLSENTKKYYSQALQVAMEFDRINLSKENNLKSYQFMEKGKSATMNARFNEYKAQHFATIPDTLLDKEKKLRTKIGYNSIQITNLKNQKNGYDTMKINALENENFTCSRKLDSLITYFETAFPAYYQMKYDNKIVSIPEIQKSLDSHSAILNYFVGDSSLFIATITDSLYKMEEIPIDGLFKKQVTNYYRDIKTAEKESFITNSQNIYAKLIKPVEGYISHKEHLIVIPDDYLYYVPFETLVSTSSVKKKQYEDYSKPDYLIKSHAISYHHSATLWYNSRKKENEPASRQKANFIGFAPVFSKENINGAILSSNINIIDTTGNNLAYRSISSDLKRFNPLPYSKDEVTSIVHLFEKRRKEARAYLYSAASEFNFKNNVGGYRFIHISSHGFSNDKEPDLSGIVFSQQTDSLDKEDGVLYASETYNLNLNADLMVLSSCESGLGKLVKGEGIQALSRGFLYAGTPNIIFSLWKVLDKPTKDLMVQFYTNVLDGKSYAESLQLAKLTLIKNPATAFPYFWGGFVLVGK